MVQLYMEQLYRGCVTHNLQWGGCKEAKPLSHSVHVQVGYNIGCRGGIAYNREPELARHSLPVYAGRIQVVSSCSRVHCMDLKA